MNDQSGDQPTEEPTDRRRVDEPADGDERSLLLGWLAFHREGLRIKVDGLTPTQLVQHSAPPSAMTLLGLMRHLTEMERVYAAYALGPKQPLIFVWGEYTDDGPEWDFDVDDSMVAESFERWHAEMEAADRMIAAHPSLDTVGGNGRSVRWNLHKLVGEYARHLGHADLLREQIDGARGE